MDTQLAGSTHGSIRPSPVHRVDEVVPVSELPAVIGLALAQEKMRGHLVAIGLRGGFAHVLIAPATDRDEAVAFKPKQFAYVLEMGSFGEILVGPSIGGVRALRVTGRSDTHPGFSPNDLRPTLEAHGPALMDATRGYLSGPIGASYWMVGAQGKTVHVQRNPHVFNTEPHLTLGIIDGRFAITASGADLALVNSGTRASASAQYPEWPEPRLQPVCMDDVGSHLPHLATHVSAALWPGKTRKTDPARRPRRWYHLVQGEGKTTLVSVGSDEPGRSATFRTEGRVVHNRFARVVFLDALGDGIFLTRDAVTGMVRPLCLEDAPFLPKEVNALIRSF